MLLIDALNVRSGGGVTLLNYLINELEKRDLRFIVALNEDVSLEFFGKKIERFKFKKIYRKKILQDLSKKYLFSSLLCFGNFPPPIFINNCTTFTFVQSMFQADNKYLPSYLSFRKKIYIKISNNYFNLYKKNSDYFILQANHVRDRLLLSYNIDKEKCFVLPFYNDSVSSNHEIIQNQKRDFVYISTGEIHKNHLTLLKAWDYICDKVGESKLHITISDSDFERIVINFPAIKNVVNHGFINKSEVEKLYESSEFCIYPSLLETLGLGLIEAASFNCKVIASNLPFVYEVILPSATFNPFDCKSIAEAILHALNRDLKETTVVLENNIEEFIRFLYQS